MDLTRRDFLKATTVIGAGLGLTAIGLPRLRAREAQALEGAPRVIWLQASGCTGCSVSFLNSVYYATADTLLTQTLDLDFHATMMAGAGDPARLAAQTSRATKGYVLVVEGAIPTGANGQYCTLWPGVTALSAVKNFAANAAYVIAVGTCASYGGMAAGAPNPTQASSVTKVLGKSVLNIPGCPVHPDWLVGSVAYILKNGKLPALDANGRPRDYFGTTVHQRCPLREYYEEEHFASQLGQWACQYGLGCRGPVTGCDCPTRHWNSPAAATYGANWCIGGRSPCQGCTQPTFPDGMSPFYKAGTDGGTGATTSTSTTGRSGGDDDETDGSTGATTVTSTTRGSTTRSTARRREREGDDD